MIPDSSPLGLRERKKLQTRAALERAALDLAASRRFESVTAEDIAAAAGVSPSTFFRYFESKEAVILQGHMDRLALLAETLEAADPDEPLAQVGRRALARLARSLSADRVAVLEMVAVTNSSDVLLAWGRAHQHEVTSRIASVVAPPQAAGPTEARPWLLANNWIAVAAYSLLAWAAADGAESLEGLMMSALDFCEAGFPTVRAALAHQRP